MKKKRLTILDKAELAMKQAIKKVVAQHKKDGRPLAVWENGRVKRIYVK
ncbi:MAG: hypothetical protein PHU64_00260 [Candidatus Omnitrophica bacterium]|nr:hypothetical protein [Candidatus Omnitrophota bacterium]MDD5430392.1 hypothetical protein [Candidatus Omnitrophota bacterium]